VPDVSPYREPPHVHRWHFVVAGPWRAWRCSCGAAYPVLRA